MEEKEGCIDRMLNGKKVCTELIEGSTNEYLCDAEWCKFHPNYKKKKSINQLKFTPKGKEFIKRFFRI